MPRCGRDVLAMEKRNLTSIVSYPERGIGGNNQYRGNCSCIFHLVIVGAVWLRAANKCPYLGIV